MKPTRFTNAGRADAAHHALTIYIAQKYNSIAEDSIYDRAGDLICDLLHLAFRNYQPGDHTGDWRDDSVFRAEALLDRALSHFQDELGEESNPAL